MRLIRARQLHATFVFIAGHTFPQVSRWPVSEEEAAERIAIRADIGDDVRLAARQVDITAEVADDAVIAAETVTLSPDARIGGRLWAAGRLVEVGGSVGDEIRVAGQTIVISGTVTNDAILTGQRIEVLPGASIGGNLVYRSNEPAVIAEGATIGGRVERKPLDMPERPDVPAWPFAVGVLLSLLICFNVFYWLLPARMQGAAALIHNDTFRALGIGLVIVLVMPVAGILLMVTILGIPLGVVLLLLYPVVLLLGFAAGILWMAGRLLGLVGRRDMSRAVARISGVLVVLVIFFISQFIPFLGALLFLFLLLAGVGALVMRWRTESVPARYRAASE